MKKTYVSTKNIHLSAAKLSVQRGATVVYQNDNGKESYVVGSSTIEDMSDFNICVKHGLFKLLNEKEATTVQTMPVIVKKSKDDVQKMEIRQSDEDMMTKVIDIRDTKTEQIAESKRMRDEASRKEQVEETGRETRGMKIVRDASRELTKEIKLSTDIKGQEVAEPSEIGSIADGINEGAVVVAKIGKNAEEASKLSSEAKQAAEVEVKAVTKAVKDTPSKAKKSVKAKSDKTPKTK